MYIGAIRWQSRLYTADVDMNRRYRRGEYLPIKHTDTRARTRTYTPISAAFRYVSSSGVRHLPLARIYFISDENLTTIGISRTSLLQTPRLLVYLCFCTRVYTHRRADRVSTMTETRSHSSHGNVYIRTQAHKCRSLRGEGLTKIQRDAIGRIPREGRSRPRRCDLADSG